MSTSPWLSTKSPSLFCSHASVAATRRLAWSPSWLARKGRSPPISRRTCLTLQLSGMCSVAPPSMAMTSLPWASVGTCWSSRAKVSPSSSKDATVYSQLLVSQSRLPWSSRSLADSMALRAVLAPSVASPIWSPPWSRVACSS